MPSRTQPEPLAPDSGRYLLPPLIATAFATAFTGKERANAGGGIVTAGTTVCRGSGQPGEQDEQNMDQMRLHVRSPPFTVRPSRFG
jgi:hypothetical protein